METVEFVKQLVQVTGGLVATGVLSQGWRRFPSRGGKLALIGFLLMLGSGLARLAAFPLLRALDLPRVTLSIAFSLLALPGFVGVVLIVYAFWVIIRRYPSVQPPEGSNRL